MVSERRRKVNKLIDGFFEHKLLVQILSVLTAILLWFIVLDNNNPMTTRSISVPINSNIEVLEEHNLRIIGPSAPFTVGLTIKGREKSVSGITPNDFKVFLDYNKITTSGEIDIELDSPEYIGTSNLRIMGMNPAFVTLKLERITGVEFPVQGRWTGELPEGYKAVNVKIDPPTIILEDKESLVNQVEKVIVTIDANSLEKTSNLSRRVLVLDANNKSITQFDGKSSVLISYDLVRTLPVTTKVVGTPIEDWFFKSFRIQPTEVQILGKYEGLSSLTSVQAEDIDITAKEGSYTDDLILKVPEGFTLYGTKPQVQAEIDLEKLLSKDFIIPVTAIEIINKDTAVEDPILLQMRYISESTTVTLKGKAKDIETFDASTLRLSIDTSGLTEGEHQVTVIAEETPAVKIINILPVNLVFELIPVVPEETVIP